MAQVAKMAGVHQTTVSLALRDHPSIPEATRERIRAIAEKAGYRRNPFVAALMAERRKGTSGKGARLAFLTVWESRGLWRRESPTYARLFDLMTSHSESLGYGLEEFWLSDPGLSPDRLRQILLNRGIRGLILCPLPGKMHEITFDFSDFAVVALRYTLRKPALDHVSIDYCAAMNLAIDRLWETGHRKIAFATVDETDERVNHLSLGAFLARRHFEPTKFLPPIIGQWSGESFLPLIKEKNPDAIITSGHLLHCKFEHWLKKAGKKLPQDLSMVCLDCHLNEETAGIFQNLEGEAHVAIDLLTHRIERAQFGLPQRPQAILVEGTWRDGPYFAPRRQ